MADASAETGPGRVAPAVAAKVTARITTLSVATACILIVAKTAGVVASGSVALLSSLADSGLDLTAALATFFAVRYAATPADREHRFGHGKAEAFAAIFQAALVFVSAALIAREAVARLLSPRLVEAGAFALAVMAFSLVVTIALVWAQTRALKASGSIAVAGDRAHYASDIAANISVAVGIAVAAFGGIAWVDPLVGAGVAAWLAWSAFNVASGALDQMMDRELPDEDRRRIKALALEDGSILDIHELRTRAAGPLIHIQFHVDVDKTMTVEDAHKLLVRAERRILAAYPGADVLIHADPKGAAEPHGQPVVSRETRTPA